MDITKIHELGKTKHDGIIYHKIAYTYSKRLWHIIQMVC